MIRNLTVSQEVSFMMNEGQQAMELAMETLIDYMRNHVYGPGRILTSDALDDKIRAIITTVFKETQSHIQDIQDVIDIHVIRSDSRDGACNIMISLSALQAQLLVAQPGLAYFQ